MDGRRIWAPRDWWPKSHNFQLHQSWLVTYQSEAQNCDVFSFLNPWINYIELLPAGADNSTLHCRSCYRMKIHTLLFLVSVICLKWSQGKYHGERSYFKGDVDFSSTIWNLKVREIRFSANNRKAVTKVLWVYHLELCYVACLI